MDLGLALMFQLQLEDDDPRIISRGLLLLYLNHISSGYHFFVDLYLTMIDRLDRMNDDEFPDTTLSSLGLVLITHLINVEDTLPNNLISLFKEKNYP